MAYWLIKTEPGTYSWDDLEKDGRTSWDGVRNYLARNNLAAMKVGDRCFLYHSVGPRDVVGVAEVVKPAYQDPTTPDERWVCVDIEPRERLKRPITLAEIKDHPLLSKMELVRMSRLSVAPVSKEEWRVLLAVSKEPPPGPSKKKTAPKKKSKKASKKKTAPKKKAPVKAAR